MTQPRQDEIGVKAHRLAPFAPESQIIKLPHWLSREALHTKVEAHRYKVQKAKLKNACGKIYALDKNGARAELFVDPTSGEIAGQL